MINYSPFWETLEKSNMTTYKLIKYYNMSGSTIQRLRDNKPISTKTLNDLCCALKCNVGDIMTYEPSDQDQFL